MNETTVMEMKFTVIKNDDINKYLDDRDKSELSRILWKIGQLRYEEGKETENKYLVINTDESYAPKVVEIMKENNHWGPESDPNQLMLELEGESLILPKGGAQ